MPEKITYWQIGSGQGERDYSRECLDYGLAFVGERYWTDVQRVNAGDIVILRSGTKSIVAVGRAVGHQGEVRGFASEENKSWLRDFNGWDLPAYIYVDWYKPRKPVQARVRLAQRAIAQVGLKSGRLREQADQILDEDRLYESNHDGPLPTSKIGDEEINEFLESELGVESARETLSTILQIRRLSRKYYDYGFRHWGEFKEHEIRTFLIVPLLTALGWRREQIKIELNPRRLGERSVKSIDVAGFSSDYQPGEAEENRNNCKLVIESKRFDAGLTYEAFSQARHYAEPMPNCNLILITNGYCYKAFTRSKGEAFPDRPSAYLNLLKPRNCYPLYPSETYGALEVLRLLLPRALR